MPVSIQLYVYSLTLKGHTRENQALKVGEKPQRRKDQVPSTSATGYDETTEENVTST